MKHPIIIKFFSAIINLLTFIIITLFILISSDWFQIGDNIFFIFFTIPLTLAIAFSGSVLLKIITTTDKSTRKVYVFIISILFSLIWFFVSFAFWGSSENPFHFQPFYLWILGSYVQLLFLDRYLPKETNKIEFWKIIIGIVSFPVILIVMWIIFMIANHNMAVWRNNKERMEELESQKKNYLLRFNDTINDKYGYINRKGDTIIPQGKYTMCFTDTFKTYAIVLEENLGYLAINREEDILYHVFRFDNGPDYTSDGLFRIVENNKIGFADSLTGDIIIQPQFDCAFPFEKGIAKVSNDCITKQNEEHATWLSNHWFYIDKNGNKVLPPL